MKCAPTPKCYNGNSNVCKCGRASSDRAYCPEVIACQSKNSPPFIWLPCNLSGCTCRHGTVTSRSYSEVSYHHCEGTPGAYNASTLTNLAVVMQ
jgi:hypothetical protein